MPVFSMTPMAIIIPITPTNVPRNRILAAAYADSLESWRPFLIFGL